MNEGIGGTSVIVIIVVFIAVVSAYMAYNVNYTKAFRMKNKIIALYEEYDGHCEDECRAKIKAYGDDIGYTPAPINCENNFYRPEGDTVRVQPFDTTYGFCEYKVTEEKSYGKDYYGKINKDSFSEQGYYFRIVTRIDIRIPIVQNVFDLRMLYVTGDTKTFRDKITG